MRSIARGRRVLLPSLFLALVALAAAGCRATPKLPSGEVRFVDLGDGTVRDAKTGLVWSRSANLPGFASAWDGMAWEAALEFVSSMNAGTRANFGHTDWRAPRAEELREFLVGFWRSVSWGEDFIERTAGVVNAPDERQRAKKTDTAPFVDFVETGYWSGTNAAAGAQGLTAGTYAPDATSPNARDPGPDAWVVDTGGKPFPLPKSSLRRLWPVRGGTGAN